MDIAWVHGAHNLIITLNSLICHNLLMPRRIITMAHDLKPVRIHQRQAPHVGSRCDLAIRDVISHEVGSLDVPRSESYTKSYSTRSSYDPYNYPSSRTFYSNN